MEAAVGSRAHACTRPDTEPRATAAPRADFENSRRLVLVMRQALKATTRHAPWRFARKYSVCPVGCYATRWHPAPTACLSGLPHVGSRAFARSPWRDRQD